MHPIGCNQPVAHGIPGMLPLFRSNNFTHGKLLGLWQLKGRNREDKAHWKGTYRKGLNFFFPLKMLLKAHKIVWHVPNDL